MLSFPCRIFSPSNFAYSIAGKGRNGAPKQEENVASGSLFSYRLIVFAGFRKIIDGASDPFNMIFEKGEAMIPDGRGGKKDAFIDLPDLAVVFGAMWLTNLG
ncbi:MAG: hypothetical protein MRZ79_17000 [Bacteroidia bacterium]|nr:hypothetical protein [Bacteroidia bacterium]